MPCFHPLTGDRLPGGQIAFSGPHRRGSVLSSRITVACGQCIGCRAERSRQWGVRGIHELQTAGWAGIFLTLTYSDANLPENACLSKRDWQLFAKRVRKQFGPFRFLMCGEYGSGAHTRRPHYHVAMFGVRVTDGVLYQTTKQGHKLFTSPTLDKLWGNGIHMYGEITFDSVNYVAGYINKKVTGKGADAHYKNRVNLETGEVFDLVPEFALMSRNKGLGTKWIEQFHRDVYPSDEVIVNGKRATPPDFYDRWMEKHDPELMLEVKEKRLLKAKEIAPDNTPERLAVKKKVFTKRYASYKRRI